MDFVKTPNLQIQYQKEGKGRVLLVLLHGNFASCRWWQPVLNALPTGITAFAPVLRGCGGTRGTTDNLAIPLLAEDLWEFTRALEIRRFHLVGHSLGGAIALQYALDHPRHLKSLTLVGPATAGGLSDLRRGESASARALQRLQSPITSLPLLEMTYQLGRIWGFNRPALTRAIQAMMPTLSLDRAKLAEFVKDAEILSSKTVMGFYNALERWAVLDKLSSLKVPSRILWGSLDAIVPQEAVVQTALALPRCRLEIWPHVGHAPQLERPEDFTNFLIRFIRWHSPSLLLRLPLQRLWQALWGMGRK